MKEFLRLSGERPDHFRGTITLPRSKSYIHRALFISSICATSSRIMNCDELQSEDVTATINALKCLGTSIDLKRKRNSRSDILVRPGPISSSGERDIFVQESGTTARFLISLAAISRDGGYTTIIGGASLRKRPMQPLLDALAQIGVDCQSRNRDGALPVIVHASGIEGGECVVESSISSQFISSLLIACTQARKDTRIKLAGKKSDAVSVPYIRATLAVLSHFGFSVRLNENRSMLEYLVEGRQTSNKGRVFRPPGDMSSGAAIIGATLAANGKVKIKGVDSGMPQADYAFLDIAGKLGAKFSMPERSSIIVSAEEKDRKEQKMRLDFDLKDAPDLVPVLAGTASALRRSIKIRNVGHVRFKESDRLKSLEIELAKIGMRVRAGDTSISISANYAKAGKSSKRKGLIILNPHGDHRILMSLVVAALSGNFGELLISNPSCVAKSYPSFIADLSMILKDGKEILSIVKK